MGYEWWRGWSAARALGWSVGEGLEVRRACGPTVFTTHEEEEKKSVSHFGTLYLFILLIRTRKCLVSVQPIKMYGYRIKAKTDIVFKAACPFSKSIYTQEQMCHHVVSWTSLL